MRAKVITPVSYTISVLICVVLSYSAATAQDGKPMVRLAIIEVDAGYIDQYNALLKEEIQASMLKEPGVITLYAVAEKENPQRITLFETYADSMHYKAHLTTPHFQKYKQGTLQFVKHLELIETESIVFIRKKGQPKSPGQETFARVIKLEVDLGAINNFDNVSERVMVRGIDEKSGVVLMYAVVEKWNPTHVNILEVYASREAYETHSTAPHFLNYIDESNRIVKSIKLIDVNPILLGDRSK